ncbi:MAG: hypothetical protein KDC95_18420 [Planctomycetes bacterium]|nr:hypothetical protein [Planctomycetota bacterium]
MTFRSLGLSVLVASAAAALVAGRLPAQISQLLSQREATVYWGEAESTVYTGKDIEAADDFDIQGELTELWFPFRTCVLCTPATVVGLHVRFYDVVGNLPGTQLASYYLTPGNGLTVTSSSIMADLPRPFLATGRHFVSAQIHATGAHGTGWAVANPTGPSGDVAVTRDRGTNGAWTQVSVPRSSSVDLGMSILGIAATAPIVYPDPGGAWIEVSPPLPSGAVDGALADVKVFASGDVWACGNYRRGSSASYEMHGFLAHFDGQKWTEVTLPVIPNSGYGSVDATGVDGTSSKDLWIIGQHSQSNSNPSPSTKPFVLHYDGTSFRQVSIPTTTASVVMTQIEDVEARSSTDVWFAGAGRMASSTSIQAGVAARWDGTSMRSIDLPRPTNPNESRFPRRVLALRANDVWIVGGGFPGSRQNWSEAFSLHFDGNNWQEFALPLTGFKTSASSIGGTIGGPLHVVGAASVTNGSGIRLAWAWNGSKWDRFDLPSGIADIHLTGSELRGTGSYAATYFATGWSVTTDIRTDFGGTNRSAGTARIDGLADGTLFAVGLTFESSGRRPFAITRVRKPLARSFDGRKSYPLTLRFVPQSSPTSGRIELGTGNPTSIAAFLLGAFPGHLALPFGDLLVDASPAWSTIFATRFGSNGTSGFSIDLRSPALIGVSVYVQGLEIDTSATIRLANAMHLLFAR